MKLTQGTIPGLLIFEPVIYSDDRGSFMETYNMERFAALGFHEVFVQDNESVSGKGVIRALHFQNPPMAQGKLVRVVRGAVMDVAVDIRQGSPWYGQHQKVVLTRENRLMFWLPPGFAHGFVALEEDSVVNYKCTSIYSHEHEHSIRWDDPDLGIDWGVEHPLVSERDRNATPFHSHKGLFIYQQKEKKC
jgi:dTDP-4-dehydrorhamnose 3,5-epimerase